MEPNQERGTDTVQQQAPATGTTRTLRWIGITLLVLVLAATLIGVFLWRNRPRVSEEQVRAAVYTTIQREAAASFLVTGTVDMMATTRVTNTRVLLPDLLDIPLGTIRSSVRMPGRVSYGIDVTRLRPEMIRLHGDTLVELQLPPLSIFSVEPQLARMEVETTRGWLRASDAARDRVERRAIVIIERALRQQATEHLRNSVQPRVNTARAMERTLAPVLEAVGIAEPQFQIEIGQGVTVRPGS